MLPGIAKILLVGLLSASVIWALILGWWQANDHQPTTGEIALYLAALPVSLLVGFWLLRTFIDQLRKHPADGADLSRATFPAASSPAHAATAEAERMWLASLIGGTLISAAGADAADLIAAAMEGGTPSPDKELRDSDGFPVFVARVSDLDMECIREDLREHGDGIASQSLPPEMLRALALIGKALPAALETLHEVCAHPGKQNQTRVIWLTPDWPKAFSGELTGWLQRTYLDGFGISSPNIELRPVHDDGQVFEIIDEIIVALNRTASAQIVLLFGAVSHLGEATLEHWRLQERLFSATEQDGQVPGEAAVALVLARPGTTLVADAPPAVHLTRSALGKREKSADARGRVSGTLINDLVDTLVTNTKLDPAKIAAVISDTDHRNSRVNEILTPVTERFPNLEPLRDTLALGASTGTVTPIGGLLALLCAAEVARNSSGAGLCVTNQHAFARASMLALAVPEPASPKTGNA